MRTMLVEADYFRHSRRFVHSHSRTPGFLFLSPEWPSCVCYMTERKEKLAERTPKILSLRSCSKIAQSGTLDGVNSVASAGLTHKSSTSQSSAEPQQQREASACDYRCGRDRNPKNHLNLSNVTGA